MRGFYRNIKHLLRAIFVFCTVAFASNFANAAGDGGYINYEKGNCPGTVTWETGSYREGFYEGDTVTLQNATCNGYNLTGYIITDSCAFYYTNMTVPVGTTLKHDNTDDLAANDCEITAVAQWEALDTLGTSVYFTCGDGKSAKTADGNDAVFAKGTPYSDINPPFICDGRYVGYWQDDIEANQVHSMDLKDFLELYMSEKYPNTTFTMMPLSYDGYATIKVTLNNQSATTAGTTAYYYKYNTYNGSCYYFSNSSLTTCLAGATDGTKITIPTKTGYTFGGYYTGANGTGTQYVNASGVTVNNIYKAVSSDITLYAKWTPSTYAVALDSKYYATSSTTTGTAVTTNAAPTPIYVKYNTDWYTNNSTTTYFVNLSTLPAYTGYTFGGFYTGKAGTGKQIIDASGKIVKGYTTAFTKNTTLYAKWTIKSDKCEPGEYLAKGATSCTSCPTGSYCPGGTFNYNASSNQGINTCSNKPSNSVYSGTGATTSSCPWSCNAGYYGSSANGNTSCAACGSGNFCTGGTHRAACTSVVKSGSPTPTSIHSLSSGNWSDLTHATKSSDCVCSWNFSDETRTNYLRQTECQNGPTGPEYTKYSDCRTGYYATNPLTFNQWYTSCEKCTNGPSNSEYTSYSTPSADYAVESNCPWRCKANYYKSGSSCAACPSNSSSEAGATSCTCNDGFNYNGSTTTTTNACEANTYEATFKCYSGPPHIGARAYYDSSYTLTVPSNCRGRVGYTHTGWVTLDDDGNEVEYGLTDTFVWKYLEDKNFNAVYTVNTYTITLDSKYYANSSATSGTNVSWAPYPDTIYEHYNNGWYEDDGLSMDFTSLTELPIYETYVFAGFFTGKAGTGTQVIASDGRIIAPNFLFDNDATIYAHYISCTCNSSDESVSSCSAEGTNGSGDNSCYYNVTCADGYSYNGFDDGERTFTISGEMIGVPNYTATCKKIGAQTGYTCPADSTRYTSCHEGKYMVTMDASGNYEYNGTPTSDNSCQPCPADAAYCPGGTSAPLYKVQLNDDIEESVAGTLYANVNNEYYIDEKGMDTIFGLDSLSRVINLPTSHYPDKHVGLMFNGYWTQSTGGEQYIDANGNFIKGPSADVTLHAQWVPTTYNITLDDNGGTGGSGSIKEVYDDLWASANGSEIDDVAIPTRTGYTFTGYYTTDGAKIISENGVIIASYTTFTENTTLYAQWTANTFIVSYDEGSSTEGFDIAEAPTDVTCTYDQDCIVGKDVDYTLDSGYKMKWVSLSDGKEYQTGDNIKNVITENGGIYSLDAETEPRKVGIEYNIVKDGVWGETISLGTCELNKPCYIGCSDVTQNCETSDLVPVGYKLTSIEINTDSLEDVVIKMFNGVEDIRGHLASAYAGQDYEILLYIYVEPIQYTVTFDANGGNGTMATQTFTYGEPQNLTANAFTRTGYTFNGWNTAADGSGTAYADKAPISNLLSDITLYAQWEQSTFTIKYYDGATELTYLRPTTYNVTSSTITLPTPIKNGYTFAGWYDNSGLIGTAVETIATGSTGDKTFYAKWTPHTIFLTYFADSAKIGTQTCTVGKPCTVGDGITLPTKTGYTFSHWGCSGVNECDFDPEVQNGSSWWDVQPSIGTSDNDMINMYAKWTQCAAGTFEQDGVCVTCPSNSSSTAGQSYCNCNSGFSIGGTGNTVAHTGEPCVPTVYKVVLDNKGADTPGTAILYKTKIDNVSQFYEDKDLQTPITQIEIPTKRGHTFVGYAIADSAGAPKPISATGHIDDGPNYTGSGNKTLYAQWTQCAAGTFEQDGVCVTCPSNSSSTAGATSCTCNDGYMMVEGACVEPEFTITTTDMAAESTFSFEISASGTFYVDFDDGRGVQKIDRTNNTTNTTYTSAAYANAGTHTIKMYGDATGYSTSYNTAAISFKNNTNIKSVDGSLGSIFGGSARSYMFYSTFQGCTSLQSIPENLFSGVSGSATSMFNSTFHGCTSLQSIPENLFSGVTGSAISMFNATFKGCISLQSIPETLFSGVTGSADSMFHYTFQGCTSLQSIPETLFSGVTGSAGSMFSSTFSGCTSLQSIPENLFSGVTDSANYMFYGTFAGCTSLQSIPETLFSGVTGSAGAMFNSTFDGCTSLQSIPETLFSGVTGSANYMFHATFWGCTSLTSLPNGLFKNIEGKPQSGMFDSTFNNCSKLTGYIPANTFEKMDSTDFDSATMSRIFTNTALDTQCPAGTYQYITGFESAWNGKVSCTPCPSNSSSESGATECTCNTGYNHNGGTTTTTDACVVNQYTVTFDANDGTGSMAEQKRTYNDGIKLTANTFTRGGYTFAGWNTAANGSGTSYADGTTENLTDENGVTITLYAQWSQCPAGTYSENGVCVTCPAGTYSANGTCVTCPKGSYCANGIKNSCSEGTYADKEGMSECTACPVATNQYGAAYFGVTSYKVTEEYDILDSIDTCAAMYYYVPEYMMESVIGMIVQEAIDGFGYDPNTDANKRGFQIVACSYNSATDTYTTNCEGLAQMCSGGGYYSPKVPANVDPENLDVEELVFQTDTLDEFLVQACVPVGVGYWSPDGKGIDFENIDEQEMLAVMQRHACPTGLTTIGYGAGADEAGDCGRVLHVDGKKLYLRSVEKTDVSLHVKVDGVTFFGNMVVGDRKISAGADKTLKIKHNGQIYSVYDDSVN